MSKDGTRPLAGQHGDGAYDLAPSAGRELDVLIAEKVFGLVRCQSTSRSVDFPNDYCYALPDSPDQGGEVKEYSTDIAAAWLVVEAIAARGYHWKINTPFMPDQQYHAGFTENGVTGWNGYPDYRDSGNTAPLAICRAALRLPAAAPGRADD